MRDGRAGFLGLFAYRLFVFLILVAILFVMNFFFPDFYRAEVTRVEISGFSAGEKVVIEQPPFAKYRLEMSADEAGSVIFSGLPLGDWKVIEGGTSELREVMFPIRELMGRFTEEGGELRILPQGNGWYCARSRRRGWWFISWWDCAAFIKKVAKNKVKISFD